jgi:phospholipid/cholesterol/gamma-HCH transport system ATP-binding protein
MIVLRDVHKRFGSQVVLDGVDLDVQEGETLALLGPSGTGKSVLLKHIIGLIRPDRGTIVVDDEDVCKLKRKELAQLRSRIGYVFQNGALFDSMDVFENVAFPLRAHTELAEREIAAKVAEVLESVELPGIEERAPSALSGGMRKRVALARALVLQPEVLLFDEPTTGLDPMTSDSIAYTIATARDRHRTTAVVVTHDLPLARSVASRLAFLEEGQFRFIGTWDEADANSDPLLRHFLAGKREDA